jgi:hypothetical protein
MEWLDILTDGYNRIPDYVNRIVEGLSRDDLKWMPTKDTNSIGWSIWHGIRGMDAQIASLAGTEQLYIKDGWAAKFNRPADPGDTGFGDGPAELAAFEPPEASVLAGYTEVCVKRAIEYMGTLTAKDLDRELGGHWTPPPTVGVRLVSIMEDATIHAAEAAYARGLRQGMGWQPY